MEKDQYSIEEIATRLVIESCTLSQREEQTARRLLSQLNETNTPGETEVVTMGKEDRRSFLKKKGLLVAGGVVALIFGAESIKKQAEQITPVELLKDAVGNEEQRTEILAGLPPWDIYEDTVTIDLTYSSLYDESFDDLLFLNERVLINRQSVLVGLPFQIKNPQIVYREKENQMVPMVKLSLEKTGADSSDENTRLVGYVEASFLLDEDATSQKNMTKLVPIKEVTTDGRMYTSKGEYTKDVGVVTQVIIDSGLGGD